MYNSVLVQCIRNVIIMGCIPLFLLNCLRNSNKTSASMYIMRTPSWGKEVERKTGYGGGGSDGDTVGDGDRETHLDRDLRRIR